jgi:hypothetical protein
LQIAEYAWEGGAAGMAELLARTARTADDAGCDVIGILSRVDPIASLETIGREVMPAVAEAD